jgi:hypothetical protein
MIDIKLIISSDLFIYLHRKFLQFLDTLFVSYKLSSKLGVSFSAHLNNNKKINLNKTKIKIEKETTKTKKTRS